MLLQDNHNMIQNLIIYQHIQHLELTMEQLDEAEAMASV